MLCTYSEAQSLVHYKATLPRWVPLFVHTDARLSCFTQTLPKHHHESSDVRAEGTDEKLGCRQLLEVC